jgi:hypothetical protein
MEHRDPNNYQIITPSGEQFQVAADDSDEAVLNANKIANERSILSCRATLQLLKDHSTPVTLGQFDLKGHNLPQSWGDIIELKKDTHARARRDAERHWDFPFMRSRGMVLCAGDGIGNFHIASGDCWIFPYSLAQFHKDVVRILEAHPDVKSLWITCGINGASTLDDLNNGLHEPWIGEATTMVWHRDAPQGVLDRSYHELCARDINLDTASTFSAGPAPQ